MKAHVYPRGANPRIDRHIQRKSMAYCVEQVEVYGTAEWVDPKDQTKGIICCDFLYLGEKVSPPSPGVIEKLKKRLRSSLPPAEVGNCRFVHPTREKNPTLVRINIDDLVIAAAGWDWSKEPASA